MILGQLIQTGRRFCECRSADFVPSSDERVIVLFYTIHDRLEAHSFETNTPTLISEIQEKLLESQAVAYILIHRRMRDSQPELPFPFGREPMDRIVLTAATEDRFETESYYLERREKVGAFKLLPTSTRDIKAVPHLSNLFPLPEEPSDDCEYLLFPDSLEMSS
ncbi:hypothetical protein [Pelagicoccus albus]|uniref:Uncharacterized protein n=1 Tax=Pelagicoccus albus TaxID=415222 RepID=A0A7X1E6W0_9BACT|nr:hypothetical protein [Pelagicoccus albus]MBC2604684.1 hypothetical protein [Pelagicoccus albus]